MNYLLDTNIIVYYYTPKEKYARVREIFDNPDNTLHILEVSIPEVIAAFYKKCYGSGAGEEKLNKDELRDAMDAFIKDADRRGTLKYMIHQVMARDIKLTDTIWQKAEDVFEKKILPKKGKKNFLDAFDALLIAIAMHLSRTQGMKGNVKLLTSDLHLGEVAKEFGIDVENPV